MLASFSGSSPQLFFLSSYDTVQKKSWGGGGGVESGNGAGNLLGAR